MHMDLCLYPELKELGRYSSLNHNIYIAAYPNHVDIDQAAHARHCIICPKCLLSESRQLNYFRHGKLFNIFSSRSLYPNENTYCLAMIKLRSYNIWVSSDIKVVIHAETEDHGAKWFSVKVRNSGASTEHCRTPYESARL